MWMCSSALRSGCSRGGCSHSTTVLYCVTGEQPTPLPFPPPPHMHTRTITWQQLRHLFLKTCSSMVTTLHFLVFGPHFTTSPSHWNYLPPLCVGHTLPSTQCVGHTLTTLFSHTLPLPSLCGTHPHPSLFTHPPLPQCVGHTLSLPSPQCVGHCSLPLPTMCLVPSHLPPLCHQVARCAQAVCLLLPHPQDQHRRHASPLGQGIRGTAALWPR